MKTLRSLPHIGVIVCAINLSHKHHRTYLRDLALVNYGGTYLENPSFLELMSLFDVISNVTLEQPQMIMERIQNDNPL